MLPFDNYSTIQAKFIPAIIAIACFLSPIFSAAQVKNPDAIRDMISRHKKDLRGPYKDIRWFCPDGTTRTAKDPCPDKPGNQHARYKDEVVNLAKKEHIFLGQILTNTRHVDFWDLDKAHSRLKQYQLEQYLRRTDNHWIHRKAQYYRGAVQAEDENAWGTGFYQWLLSDTTNVHTLFFLIRQSTLDIPHATDNKNAQLMRALSKEIADTMPSFQNVRIKIHGLPEVSDIQRVRDFQARYKSKIPAFLKPKFEQLLHEMAVVYRPFEVTDFASYRKRLSKDSVSLQIIDHFLAVYPLAQTPAARCTTLSQTAMALRTALSGNLKGDARLAIMDVSVRLETMLNQEANQWHPESLRMLLNQIYCLAEASAAFGFLERWEWQELQPHLLPPQGDSINLALWGAYSEYAQHAVEWGTSMVRSHYMPVIDLYSSFEPLAFGFFDDRIRSSVLLPLGSAVSRLGDAYATAAGYSNAVMGIEGQSGLRGLNPGYALGELIVDPSPSELSNLSPDKIYVFHRPPDDLKPVAGIATVTEGNLVSHVQLLARNLGIPNMRLSPENLEALKAFRGQRVFYAVSGKGTVIMKAEADMDQWEKDLFTVKKRGEDRIAVPVDRILLDKPEVLNLRDVHAGHSGQLCGPKAANLGQLKRLFPDNVVEGLVLPFALFRQHMDQQIPGQRVTYWAMLQNIFAHGNQLRQSGASDAQVESATLKGLDTLRTHIRRMPLLPAFEEALQQQFQAVLGQPMGQIPVFIRSDTNMEDLKDFTGAGLNLTVFNVLDADKIRQGIRDVWASPYTERSFKWRQRYLTNPENVYPSILIIPSINADYSGVMITQGVSSGKSDDLTVAFNRGVGGAVDGQAAEMWLLQSDLNDLLIAPARELTYLNIPPTGGSIRPSTPLNNRILSPGNLKTMRVLSEMLRKELPQTPGIHSNGPFDVELGFLKDHLWLFQVRPFVENKQALASEFLQRITPVLAGDRVVSLDLNL